MIRLRVISTKGSRQTEFADDCVVIGRSPECDLVVDDVRVSRRHAELRLEQGRWVLVDLGTANGCFIGGERVERRAIAAHDVFTLGREVSVEVVAVVESSSALHRRRREALGSSAARGNGSAIGDALVKADAKRHPSSQNRLFRLVLERQWWLVPADSDYDELLVQAPISSLGREDGATLQLDAPSVSRVHARLEPKPDHLLVTNLKSRAGTRVNSQEILQAKVVDGDEIEFGSVRFRVECQDVLAVGRLLRFLASAVVILVLMFGGVEIAKRATEAARTRQLEAQFQRRAAESLEAGIRAFIAAGDTGDVGTARGQLVHAADVLTLMELAPKGASLDDPNQMFEPLRNNLPEDLKSFDISKVFSPERLKASEARVEGVDERSFVESKLRGYCAELGMDGELPQGFVDQVHDQIRSYVRAPSLMKRRFQMAERLRPRVEPILAAHGLPPSFFYVAWIESGLDTMAKSEAGALGLWQLMPSVASDYRLRVDLDVRSRDERTHVEPSTHVAARYFSRLLKDQGPEYFFLVLDSYNAGPGKLDKLKQKIDKPMLRSIQKYWSLVEQGEFKQETEDYVPRYFATRILAEHRARFRV